MSPHMMFPWDMPRSCWLLKMAIRSPLHSPTGAVVKLGPAISRLSRDNLV